MDYHFPPDLQPYVDEMLASGAYSDVHALILDAVYRHRDLEQARRQKYDDLKKDLAIGVEQLDRGQVKDGPAFFRELLADLGDEGGHPS